MFLNASQNNLVLLVKITVLPPVWKKGRSTRLVACDFVAVKICFPPFPLMFGISFGL